MDGWLCRGLHIATAQCLRLRCCAQALNVNAEGDGRGAQRTLNSPRMGRRLALAWPAILGICLGGVLVLVLTAAVFARRRTRRVYQVRPPPPLLPPRSHLALLRPRLHAALALGLPEQAPLPFALAHPEGKFETCRVNVSQSCDTAQLLGAVVLSKVLSAWKCVCCRSTVIAVTSMVQSCMAGSNPACWSSSRSALEQYGRRF